MKRSSFLFGAALSMGLVFAAAADAATIVTQTTRANVEAATGLTGGAVTNFEALATGSLKTVIGDGVTFTAQNTFLQVDNAYAGQFSLQGKSLKSVADKRIDLSFAEAITGFGFFFGASDLTWTLTAYDGAGTLLETLLIAPTRFSNAGDFFGIRAAGIKSARLTTTSNDYVAIDDFRTSTAPLPSGAVPEPATWALMILGFGTAGAALRRRRTALA